MLNNIFVNYGQCRHKPVAEREPGGGGAVPPQQEIKLKLCPTKLKFALVILIIFTKATNDFASL